MIRRENSSPRAAAERAVSLPFLLEGWVDEAPPLSVAALCSDARHVQLGCAFVARDAAAAKRAREAGARVILHDENLGLPRHDVPAIAVPRLGDRLSALAARFYHHPADQLSLAAVSGGHGRTAAAWYIAQSWQRCHGSAGLVGRLGRGLFSSLEAPARSVDAVSFHRSLADCVSAGAEAAAIEVGPWLLNSGCLDDAALDVAVYTGPGSSRPHDETDSLLPLFDRHAPRFAVVNHDVAEGKRLARCAANGVQVLTFGSSGATELQGSILSQDSTGMTIRIASPWGGGELRTGLLGSRSLSGLLAAAGGLALMGMTWNRVMHQLEIMSPVPGRMSCIAGEGESPAAVIDHARTPRALEQVLRDLRSHLHGRLYCIVHTAGVRRRGLADAASALADEVFEVSRSNRSAVLRSVLRKAGRHDIVLIAGGGRGAWARQGEAEVRHLLEEAA